MNHHDPPDLEINHTYRFETEAQQQKAEQRTALFTSTGVVLGSRGRARVTEVMPTEAGLCEKSGSSTSSSSCSSLRASRVLGSFRQLWSDDDEPKAPDYVLRPESTRDVAGLAAELDSDEMRRLLDNTNKIPDCIDNHVSSACFQKEYPTDASFVPLVIEGCEDGGFIRPSTEWTMDSLVEIKSVGVSPDRVVHIL